MCQKLKKYILDIFKLKHGESSQYVIFRTTQSTTKIYLGGSNNAENKEQLSIFYLSS